MFRLTHSDGACGSDDTVNGRLSKRIEAPIRPPQKVGLQKIAGVAVVLELAQIELHGHVIGLEVERDQLTSNIPKQLKKKTTFKTTTQLRFSTLAENFHDKKLKDSKLNKFKFLC